jgi:predicted ATPase
VRTVESHVASLRRKLDLPDHRSLVRFAASEPDDAVPADPPLPASLTSFVGRARELAELAVALRESRLVTAVGPGGAGKTRLVLAAAEQLTQPVRWVDLVPVTEAAALDDALAHACGVAPSSRLGPVDAVVAALRGRHAVLVLDNAEHLVNAVAVLVERLLTACPDLTMLVTSRIRLAVPFERVLRVDGLSHTGPPDSDDAGALFAERARAAGASVDSTADHDRIATICGALGGLPLAIELAAGRLPTLGLSGVEQGLVDQAGLLTGGKRVSARHGSMTATLDWSVAFLEGAAARALARLAVPVASFDPDAAVAVAGFDPLTEELVRGALPVLAEHNLLGLTWPSGQPRYRMLEPIRQFGIARLDSQDEPVFARHRAWCRADIAAVRSSDDPAGIRAIADDARAALARVTSGPDAEAAELAGELGLALFRDGSLREAQTRLQQAAELRDDGRGAAAALAHAAAIARCRVRGPDALRLDLMAAERAERAGAHVDAALALTRAAETITRFSGMFGAPPTQASDELIDRARSLAPHDPHVAAGIAIATLAYANPAGRPIAEASRAAQRLARTAGDDVLESAALDGLTSSLLFGGQPQAAYREAAARVALLGATHDDPAHALEIKDALHMAVYAALGAGDLAAARDYAIRQQEMGCLREHRDLAEEETVAPAALSGDWPTVLDTARRYLADWQAAGSPAAAGRGLTPAAVALAHGLRDDDRERERWLDVLARIRGVNRDVGWRGSGYGELFEAMVLLHRNQPDDALAVLRSDGIRVPFGLLFHQWVAAFAAEAGVLARHPDASDLLNQATAACRGNPVAAAVARRAEALTEPSGVARARLEAIAAELDQAGAHYEAQRTTQLAATR